jgi:hypothetical protein
LRVTPPKRRRRTKQAFEGAQPSAGEVDQPRDPRGTLRVIPKERSEQTPQIPGPDRKEPTHTPNGIFISYCHQDEEWLERIKKALRPILHGGNITVWDDGNIPPGSNWLAEIDRAIASARIAVLLVSKDFLASSFIERKEFPDLLKRRGEGMGFFWVPIEYTLYKYTPLRDIQAVWPADRLLIGLSKADQSHALNEIATKLAEWRPE